MLSITGLNRFFFVRDFHDMRCKYDKVLSYSMFERRFRPGYKFMHVSYSVMKRFIQSIGRMSFSCWNPQLLKKMIVKQLSEKKGSKNIILFHCFLYL